MVGLGLGALIVAAAPAAVQADMTERLRSEQPAVRRAAQEAVLARPEAVDPFTYAVLSASLWQDGRRLQAAFWFYLFQARSRPWADAVPDYGSLRGALSETVGQEVNGWLGHDLVAWRALVERALAYEARLPLFAGRPDGVDAARWTAMVAAARKSYREGYKQTLARSDPAEHARERRKAGLAVGPLPQPGPPLPDGWR